MFNWRAIIAGVACISVAPTFLLLFAVILIASIFIPRKIFHEADRWLFDHSQRMVLFFYHNLWGRKLIIYGDVDALRRSPENVLYLANHQTAFDWIITELLAAVQGDIGRTRYVLKDAIRMLPFFGCYFRAHGCVYVKRGAIRKEGIFDEAYAVRQLDRLRNDRVPLWLIIFPEGTRYNTAKRREIERSQAFARANDLAVLEEVLTPRTKAVYLSLRCLKPHLDAIYDLTVGFTSTLPKDHANGQNGDSSNHTTNKDSITSGRRNAPGMFGILKHNSDIHVHVRRIPIAEAPDASLGEDVVRDWLQDSFIRKEQLMKKFLYGETKGRFGEDGVEMRIPLSSTVFSAAAWIGANILLFSSPTGRMLYMVGCFLAVTVGYAYVFITG